MSPDTFLPDVYVPVWKMTAAIVITTVVVVILAVALVYSRLQIRDLRRELDQKEPPLW